MKTLIFIALLVGNQPVHPYTFEVSGIPCEDVIEHAAFRSSWDEVFLGQPWVAWCATH